jgi:hypothetical protein
MAFEFGMFHEFQCPAGKSQPDAFAESFSQVDAAERWGLDAMWLAEIHVAPERSVCAVPLTIAAAIAARTSRIKIGTGVASRCCRCAIRCGWPRKLRRSTISARDG